ncbi:MAG: HAD hydrolase family protein [Clostridiales bacterium]|nr:HAD hydrolase family protein [Clostridiales bacterium]
MKDKNIKFPPIGMRITKSAIGVFLGFVIYYLRGGQGTPFYTALSVLWCMQPYVNDTKEKAFQRTIGTFIGAFYGTIMILLEFYLFTFDNELIRFLFISILIIPVIYTTIVINKKNASYFSCVVFLSIVVMHINDSNPYIFILNRVLDTMIGIGLSFAINHVKLPVKKQKNILFVSGIDDLFLNSQNKFSSYSKIQLNRIIDDGANFTIATMRPPAALLPAIQGIRMKLPVVAMDGAIVYDIKQNRYLKINEMSNKEANIFLEFLHERGFNAFTNVVVQDSVLIYYGEFQNKAEETIFNELRSSPYRNYLKQPLPKEYGAVYIMIIDVRDRIEMLYKDLQEAGYTKNYKILKYDSDDYPNYMYIKIYHKSADKKLMVNYIKEISNTEKIITFGEMDGISDEYIKGKDSNEMVRKFKKLYEPFIWK